MVTRPNQNRPVVRAGIYTRISWDPDGQRAGVERQRVDCEALCTDRGWEVAQHYEDYADARVMPTPPKKPLVRALSSANLSA
jgi:DNA invertase Pin-like site-specific DNA recombinase